jgi:hypothetical protein
MKELRPLSSGRSEIRILLVFHPWRAAILLVAGDKSGQWDKCGLGSSSGPTETAALDSASGCR